jgi:two-component system, cell cycle sensor histidine kinase and response regulator CckA
MQAHKAGQRMMLLTDHAGSWEFLRPLISAAGFDVAEALDRPEALTRLAGDPNANALIVFAERNDGQWLDGVIAALGASPAIPVVLLRAPEAASPKELDGICEWHVVKFPVGARDLCNEIVVALCRWLESRTSDFDKLTDHPALAEAPAGIVLTDALGTITSVNAACEGMLGIPATRLQGQSFGMLTLPSQRAIETAAQSQRRKGEISTYESALSSPLGTGIAVRINGWSRFKDGDHLGDTLIISDHRQQWQLQDEILRDHEFTSQIASRMGQGITVTNAIGCFEFVNEAFARMLGYRSEDLMGRYTVDISSDEDRAGQMVQRALRRAGHTTTYEARLLRADGSKVTVSINAVPRWKDGEFAGAISVVTDLTEQRMAAAALQESEARFRTLIECAQDGIVVNALGRIVYANPAAIEMFRLPSATAVLGRNIGEFVHPDDRESAIARTLEVATTGNPSPRTEFRGLRPDGTCFQLESVGISIVFDGYRAVCSTLRDVTNRKEAELALRESEERYRALVEWSPEPVIVHRHAKLLYANPAFVRLVGAESVEQVLTLDLLDFVHPDHQQIVRDRIRAISIGDQNFPVLELRGIGMGGREMYVETQGTAIVYDGMPAVYTVVRDLTARRRAEAARNALEAELRESHKMQAIGTLAGGIAHDFNNLLAIILGNVELALQDAGQDSPVGESLEEVRRAATRATEVVRQILSFSRRQPTQRKLISILPTVEESVRLLRATLPARLQLRLQYDAGTPPVLADSTQISQVIINLCNNAMQAMPEGPGLIEISLGAVDLSPHLVAAHPALGALSDRDVNRAARLSVRDNGPGMDESTLARIFEPFFTTKPVDQGTGLGLAVVHGIVEEHKGVIVTESNPGQGATFSVYLPIEQSEVGREVDDRTTRAKPAASATPSPQAGSKFHMLYLDDDSSLVMLVEKLMSRRGFKVSGFTDSAEAIAFLRNDDADLQLFISDYNMPSMSGLDVARVVREFRPDLPVAVTTGFVDERLQAQAHEAGVRELIFKASAIEDYCQAFERLAGKVMPEKIED